MRKIVLLILTIYCFLANSLLGQVGVSESDSLKSYTLKKIIVTADKISNELYSTSAAVEQLTKSNIAVMPISNLNEIVKYVPGYFVANLDGLGKTPVISTRGFYGGGEADYISVYLDGKQLNDAESGLVNWNMISPNSIAQLELLKGGASPLYGDAAMGGVIHINSFDPSSKYGSVNLSSGNFGSYTFSLISNNIFNNSSYNVYAGFDKTDGFRDHSKWKNYTFGGNISIVTSKASFLKISSNNQLIKSEDPGPIERSLSKDNPTNSLPYFKYDGKDERRINLGLEFNSGLAERSNLGFSFVFNNKYLDNNRSFIDASPIIDLTTFSPIGIYDTTLYANTKKNKFNSNNFVGDINFSTEIPEINTRFIVGAESKFGSYSNKYYDLFNGFYEDYNNNSAVNKILEVDAKGSRITGAGFANIEVEFLPSLKLFAGLRYDQISDNYNGFTPDTTLNIINSAFSPKLGMNYKYVVSQDYSASVYFSYNKSFKSPTINQLMDFKQLNFGIFIPAGPNFIFQRIKADPFGNSLLKPQKSNNYELGTYQMLKINSKLIAELSFTVYHTNVTDEIDFDLLTYKYGNIGESLHQGTEVGLKLKYNNNINLNFNYTYTKAEFSSGNFKGNQLKGIPKHNFNSSLSYSLPSGISTSLSMNSIGNIFLDDENLNTLPGYLIFDAQLKYVYKLFEVRLLVKNIFDTQYSNAGYLLNNSQYLFPSARRYLSVELTYNFY